MSQGILVVLEHNDNKIGRIALEALAGAQQLAAELGEPVTMAVLSDDTSALTAQASKYAAEKVLGVESAALKDYTPDGYTAALADLIGSHDPAYVVFGHSYQVRDYAPKLAARLQKPLLSDCVGFRIENGAPVLSRQVFAGKFNADYTFAGDGPHLISFQAGAFSTDALQAGSAATETVSAAIDGDAVRTNVLEIFQGVKQEVDLTRADVIVSAGRGLKEKDNLALVEELAAALGGEVAGSRPVCDDGWMQIDRQIGSSGQTVAPKLYFAVGISGAIQHVVGMKNAKYIVAVNKDPHAPIFELADVAVVADLFEVVPALTKAIREG